MNNTLRVQPKTDQVKPPVRLDDGEVLSPTPGDRQVSEIREIITSFKHLLFEHPLSSATAGIQREIVVLEKWIKSFQLGLISAARLAGNGPLWLKRHRDRLQNASEESWHTTPENESTSRLTPSLRTPSQPLSAHAPTPHAAANEPSDLHS